jgi:Na+/melibiose symporter-like transporter
VRKFALCLLPSVFAGVVMTGVHWRSGDLQAIPGTWLLLYGCALISASVATTRSIAIMGASFVTLGVVALLLGSELQVFMLGAGFGGLHILFGLLIGRKTHDCQI